MSVLLAEEHPLKLSRLRRRQSRLREYFHDLISEPPLFRGKYRRVAVPTQTSANVLVDPRFFTRDRIRESMQVPDLIEQRLKLFVGNRHDRPGYPSPGQVLPDVSTRASAAGRSETRSAHPAWAQPRQQRRRGRVLVVPARLEPPLLDPQVAPAKPDRPRHAAFFVASLPVPLHSGHSSTMRSSYMGPGTKVDP